jgi:hypothetical protein
VRTIFLSLLVALAGIGAVALWTPEASACIPRQCCTLTFCDVIPDIPCRTLVSEGVAPVAAVAVNTCSGVTGYVCTQPHVTNGIDGPISVVCGHQTSFILP